MWVHATLEAMLPLQRAKTHPAVRLFCSDSDQAIARASVPMDLLRRTTRNNTWFNLDNLKTRGETQTTMMIKATDIRRGMVITMEGINFVVVDFAHHTPGNLRAMVQTKLRNMNNGALIDKRLRSVDQIEVPYVETKEYEYLYSSGDEHVFMDTETYDQLSFDAGHHRHGDAVPAAQHAR